MTNKTWSRRVTKVELLKSKLLTGKQLQKFIANNYIDSMNEEIKQLLAYHRFRFPGNS